MYTYDEQAAWLRRLYMWTTLQNKMLYQQRLMWDCSVCASTQCGWLRCCESFLDLTANYVM